MKRGLPVALIALCALAGCRSGPLPHPYDIAAARFGPKGESVCERYAYQSGRNRYDLQRKVMGEAFASTNANQIAQLAYERCIADRRRG